MLVCTSEAKLDIIDTGTLAVNPRGSWGGYMCCREAEYSMLRLACFFRTENGLLEKNVHVGPNKNFHQDSKS